MLDYKFIALGHNTIRGAAGAAILNAELMSQEALAVRSTRGLEYRNDESHQEHKALALVLA